MPPGLTNVVDVGGDDQHNLGLIGDGPPVLRASLTNPTWSTNGFSVALPTQYERVYRLEYKNSLSDSDWIGIPLVAGNGAMRTLTDTTAEGTERYYRVRRW